MIGHFVPIPLKGILELGIHGFFSWFPFPKCILWFDVSSSMYDAETENKLSFVYHRMWWILGHCYRWDLESLNEGRVLADIERDSNNFG